MEKFIKRENEVLIDFLNEGIDRVVRRWQTASITERMSENLAKLNAMFSLLRKSGVGFEIVVNQSAIVGGRVPRLTEEGERHLIGRDERANLIFKLPTKGERKKSRSRALDIVTGPLFLHLVSSTGSHEAKFDLKDIVSIKIRP